MRHLVLMLLTCPLILSACTDTTSEQQQNRLLSTTYQCESGEKIVATYSTINSATIEYQNNSYKMTIAVSASGARYVGENYEWWTKGSGSGSLGSLFNHKENSTGEALESCTAI